MTTGSTLGIANCKIGRPPSRAGGEFALISAISTWGGLLPNFRAAKGPAGFIPA
jgi:hypothetical protein